MSQEEHDRLLIIRKVMKRKANQIKASDLLNISDRQVRNLVGMVRGLVFLVLKSEKGPLSSIPLGYAFSIQRRVGT